LISQFLLQISRITYVCYWEECLHIVKAWIVVSYFKRLSFTSKMWEEEDGGGSTCKLLSRRETMPVNFHAFTLVSSRDRVKVAIECACLLGRLLCLVGNCYHHQQVTNTYFPAQMLIHKNSNPNLLPFYCDSLKRVWKVNDENKVGNLTSWKRYSRGDKKGKLLVPLVGILGQP